MKKYASCFFVLVIGAFAMFSCQKEVNGEFEDGVTDPATVKPKVGTVWTYSYYWYNSPGGLTNYKVIQHRAVSEETFGTDKFLKIVDVETDTTVYYLGLKADGLYQYSNASSYILCKYPASIHETYSTVNDGAAEDFTVRTVNDTTATMIGNIPLTKYEGVRVGYIIDEIWYNKNAWIVWKFKYRRIAPPPIAAYYQISRMLLDNIKY